jgi:hypothetical protein
MQLTSSFVSTVALTIPVLMLAGAVELRSLADSVRKHFSRGMTEGLRQYLEMVIQIQRIITPVIEEFMDYAITTGETDFELKNTDETKIERQVNESFTLFMLRLLRLPLTIYAIPITWCVSLILAGVNEVLCLLFLSNSYDSKILPYGCLVSVGILMLLLILTPAIQTLFVSSRDSYSEFTKTYLEEMDPSDIPDLLSRIPNRDDLSPQELSETLIKMTEVKYDNKIRSTRKPRYQIPGRHPRPWPPRRRSKS